VVLTVLLACFDPLAPLSPGDDTLVPFDVPAGATGRSLTDALVAEGLVPGSWTWRWYLRTADLSCLKAGPHVLRRSMSLVDLSTALCTSPPAPEVAFTVIEGWRIRDIDAALAAQGLLPAGAYAAVANAPGTMPLPFAITSPSLEGYLYPETYRLPAEGLTAGILVARQLAAFQERFLTAYDLGDRTLHDVVVMASLLEREEPDPSQRPLVAGIIGKRLAHDWALGVDATSRYTLADWNDRRAFLDRLADPDDPYNTRLRKGLPPTAIGNPSLSSLVAALKPADSPYWYYLHDAQGQIHPALDAAGHEENRRRYDVW
jgi:UPF0755 protein